MRKRWCLFLIIFFVFYNIFYSISQNKPGRHKVPLVVMRTNASRAPDSKLHLVRGNGTFDCMIERKAQVLQLSGFTLRISDRPMWWYNATTTARLELKEWKRIQLFHFRKEAFSHEKCTQKVCLLIQRIISFRIELFR